MGSPLSQLLDPLGDRRRLACVPRAGSGDLELGDRFGPAAELREQASYRRDGRLRLEGAWLPGGERSLQLRGAFVDQLAIPVRAVLLGQRNGGAAGIQAPRP